MDTVDSEATESDETVVVDSIETDTPDSNAPSDTDSDPAVDTDTDVPPTEELLAFPGAYGWGANASGGRGGAVVHVTNLNANGEGSLNAALAMEGPRTIVFDVSGVIEAGAEIVSPNVTIAGETAPGTITVRGIVCGSQYEGQCNNVILRHLRSIPAGDRPATGYVIDDALRLDGANRVIVDHLTLAGAADECAQISMASDITIQNSILGETVGYHAEYGGMLLNYSSDEEPLDRLTIHHNLWYRFYGRQPEITCESPDCDGHRAHIELTSNLNWDPGWFVSYGGTASTELTGEFFIDLQWRSNWFETRESYPFGMIQADVLQHDNQLYFDDNHLSIYPNWSDEQLAYCCNDFALYGPHVWNAETDVALATEPLDFPEVPVTPAHELATALPPWVGAWPRGAFEERVAARVTSGDLVELPWSEPEADDFFDLAPATELPVDSDGDAMPDAWETEHQLDPQDPEDRNGTELSAAGYTNLEVYLHERAAARME